MAKPETFYPMAVRLPSMDNNKVIIVYDPVQFKSCSPGTEILERKVEHRIFYNLIGGDPYPRLGSRYDEETKSLFKYAGRPVNLFSVSCAFYIFRGAIERLEKSNRNLSKELLRREVEIESLKTRLQDLSKKSK